MKITQLTWLLVILSTTHSDDVVPSVVPIDKINSTNEGISMAIIFMLSTFACTCFALLISAKSGIHFNLILWAIGIFVGVFFNRLGVLGDSLNYIYGTTLYIVILLYTSSLGFSGSFFANNLLMYRRKWQVAIITVAGVFISTILIGILLKYVTPVGQELTLIECFVIAAIFCCIEPGAFFSQLVSLGIPPHIFTLIAGEAGASPGFSVSVYLLFETIHSSGTYDFKLTFKNFTYQILGGFASGVALAIGFSILLIFSYRPMVATLVTLFGAFFLVFYCFGQEFNLYFNALFTIFIFGHTMGYVSKEYLQPEIRSFITSTWDFLFLIADATIVLMCGGFVGNLHFKDVGQFFVNHYFWQVFIVFILVLIVRGAKFVLLWPILNIVGGKIGWKDLMFLTLVGINGTISVTFALDTAMRDSQALWSPNFKPIFVGIVCYVIPLQVLFVSIVNALGLIKYPEIKPKLGAALALKEQLQTLTTIKLNLKNKFGTSGQMGGLPDFRQIKEILRLRESTFEVIEKMVLSQNMVRQSSVNFCVQPMHEDKKPILCHKIENIGEDVPREIEAKNENLDSVSHLRFGLENFDNQQISSLQLPEKTIQKHSLGFEKREKIASIKTNPNLIKDSNKISNPFDDLKENLPINNQIFTSTKKLDKKERAVESEAKNLLPWLDEKDSRPENLKHNEIDEEQWILTGHRPIDFRVSGLSSYLELNRTKSNTKTNDSKQIDSQEILAKNVKTQNSRSNILNLLYVETAIKNLHEDFEADLRALTYSLIRNALIAAFQQSKCHLRTHNYANVLINICSGRLDRPVHLLYVHKGSYYTFFSVLLKTFSRIPFLGQPFKKEDFLKRYIEFEVIKIFRDSFVHILDNIDTLYDFYSKKQKKTMIAELEVEYAQLELYLVDLTSTSDGSQFGLLHEILQISVYDMHNSNNAAKGKGIINQEQFLFYLQKIEQTECRLFYYFVSRHHGFAIKSLKYKDASLAKTPISFVYYFPFLIQSSLETLQRISYCTKEIYYASGSSIPIFNGFSRSVYLLRKGALIFKTAKSHLKIARSPINQILIEPFLLQNLNSPITAEATDQCVLNAIDFDVFWKLLGESKAVLDHTVLTFFELFWEEPHLFFVDTIKESLHSHLKAEHPLGRFVDFFECFSVKRIESTNDELRSSLLLELNYSVRKSLINSGVLQENTTHEQLLQFSIFKKNFRLVILVK